MPTHVTEHYGTVQARIPKDLLDAVQRYATQHRFNVSELIREGLELRLEQGVPGRGDFPLNAPEAAESPEVLHALQDMQRTLQRTWEAVQDVRHVLQDQAASDGHRTPDAGHVPQGEGAAQDEDGPLVRHVLQTAPEGMGHALPSEDGASYDATKFYLGKLCPKGHMYGDSGLSLLRRHNNGCRTCENEAKKALRARQKALAQEG